MNINELVYSNLLQLEPLVELLDEKGLIGRQEVLQRVREIQMQRQARERLH
jgi:hypothetical protein